MCIYLKGAGGEGEADGKEVGAAKSKETNLASDPKPLKQIAGALQGGGAEHHANQAKVGDNGADGGVLKADVHAAYKEDDLAGDPLKQNELGARGVPLGKNVLVGSQNDLVNEQRNLDLGMKKIENLLKEQVEREVQARLEKEQVERQIEEKMARKEELEREKIEKEVQARLEREKQDTERQEMLARQQLEKELADKERVEKEVRARVEKERLEREKREKAEKLLQDKAAQNQHVVYKADSEILEKVRKDRNAEEAQGRPGQPEQAIEDRNAERAAQEPKIEDGEALKKGGRDLKQEGAARADQREDMEDGALKAEAQPQGSHEKGRDQAESDLKRRRRALGAGEAVGLQEKTGGVLGLEPLLSLGDSNLHAALEEQLLAGAMVHSRQIKQISKDKKLK